MSIYFIGLYIIGYYITFILCSDNIVSEFWKPKIVKDSLDKNNYFKYFIIVVVFSFTSFIGAFYLFYLMLKKESKL